MELEDIKSKIIEYQVAGKKIFTTCSFQAHSLVLLHVLTRIDKHIPVYFINTGYHFPETIRFKDEIANRFEINLIDLKPLVPKHNQKDLGGKLLFTSDPDYCCYLNKTHPMKIVMMQFDIWVSGIRADQSASRKSMKLEQAAPHDIIRFHPMLDWSAKDIFQYRKKHNLPDHPLEKKGYLRSIGCEPCTRKFDIEMQEREARWFGLNKTECGLHIDLINK